mgnify:FL=1
MFFTPLYSTVLPNDISFHRKRTIQYYDISAKSHYHYEKPFWYLLYKLTGKADLKFEKEIALVPQVCTITTLTTLSLYSRCI